jgi:hypothetical protein
MSGSIDVQSRARRSYKAVVIPTEALLTFGMLKLTSLMMNRSARSRWRKEAVSGDQAFQRCQTLDIISIIQQAASACSNARDVLRMPAVVVVGCRLLW